MPVRRYKTLLIWLSAGAWVVALLAALWWFQSNYVRAFDERVVAFSGDMLVLPEELKGQGMITLVHFWDPGCPCNVGNQAHLAELIESYSAQGVNFHVVQKTGNSTRLPSSLSALTPLEHFPGADQLPSSPAVAIWDRNDQLAYFGPYSSGLTCNSSNSFIEPVIAALLAGRQTRNTNALAVGCFCQWNASP